MSAIKFQGINPHDEDGPDFIGKNGLVLHQDYCGNHADYKAEDQCIQNLDSTRLETDFNKTCKGKDNCNFDLSAYHIDSPSNSSNYAKCNSQFAKVYIQFKCEMSGANVEK